MLQPLKLYKHSFENSVKLLSLPKFLLVIAVMDIIMYNIYILLSEEDLYE